MNTVFRMAAWLLALVLVALPVVAVLNGWVGQKRWPLNTLRVTGEFQRIAPEQVQSVVAPYASQGFFAVPLHDVQDAVEAMPWVSRVHVQKHWPDVLEIHIVEHVPFARWGEDRMLSVEGHLYDMPRSAMDTRLPVLSGPDEAVQPVIRFYNQSRIALDPLGLSVAGVTMDARGSWSLTLADGTEVIVGRVEPQERLDRFARVLPQLKHKRAQLIGRVDLRYTNGFTLEWVKSPVSHDPAAASGANAWPQTVTDRT